MTMAAANLIRSKLLKLMVLASDHEGCHLGLEQYFSHGLK